MIILYYDIFLLLITWFTGIGINVSAIYIHVLPLLALIAVIVRLSMPPPFVKITTNPIRVGKRIRM
ncbi:MAG: hypothetical protein WCW35_02000 [Bacteroidota bacterium]|jgi:hypothetical protein